MGLYRIGVVLEQGGYVTVEAPNLEKAEEQVLDSISDYDFDKLEVDITHRDFYTVDSSTVKE